MQTRLSLRPGERGTKKLVASQGAGGRWHPEAVAWSLPHERIVSLGLASRMIEGTVPAGFGHPSAADVMLL
jgi:hypothetical protein